MASHHHGSGVPKRARTPGFERREVRVRPDRNDRRAGIDAVRHHAKRLPRWRGPSRDRRRPIVREGERHHEAAERALGAGRDRDLGTARQLERERDVSGADTAGIVHRRDARELDVRPAEQHRERAQVVGVGAQVGVEMEPDHDDPRITSGDGKVTVRAGPSCRPVIRSAWSG